MHRPVSSSSTMIQVQFLSDDLSFQYHETMKHLSAAQSINLAASQAQLMQPPPPLPKEDTARPPPLPPATASTAHHQFTNMPPPHQNNLPLFPAKEPATTGTLLQSSATSYPPPSHQQPPPPPLPGASQQQQPPPLPPEIESRRELPGVGQAEKRDNNVSAVGDGESNGGSSAKKLKLDEEDEELTEAEKTFDAQFKQWEEQFNKWKQQNANHPDKVSARRYLLSQYGTPWASRSNLNCPNFVLESVSRTQTGITVSMFFRFMVVRVFHSHNVLSRDQHHDARICIHSLKALVTHSLLDSGDCYTSS